MDRIAELEAMLAKLKAQSAFLALHRSACAWAYRLCAIRSRAHALSLSPRSRRRQRDHLLLRQGPPRARRRAAAAEYVPRICASLHSCADAPPARCPTVGKTVNRIQEIIVELGEFQKEAEAKMAKLKSA